MFIYFEHVIGIHVYRTVNTSLAIHHYVLSIFPCHHIFFKAMIINGGVSFPLKEVLFQ